MSKLPRLVCTLLLTLGTIVFAEEAEDSGLQPGIWDVEEVLHIPLAGDRIVKWSYRFLVDTDGIIVGVGENERAKGEGGGDESAVSMVILEASSSDYYEGFYLQAFEDGVIFQTRIEGEVIEDGKKVVLDSYDGDGMVTSTIHASWVCNETPSPVRDGKWSVREIVSPDRGGWNIVWDFNFSQSREVLAGRGNKVSVNGRAAYPGERKTVSRVSLRSEELSKLSLFGTAKETNHVGGVIRAEYDGWMSPSGEWFLMESYENGVLAGLLFGNALQ